MIQIWQAFSLRGCPTNACLNGPEFQRPSSTKVTVWNMFIRLNQFFFGFRPQSFACAFLLAKLGFMIFFFKFIEPSTIQGPPCDVLHCNYNAQCVLCKVYFSAQPNKLRPTKYLGHIICHCI